MGGECCLEKVLPGRCEIKAKLGCYTSREICECWGRVKDNSPHKVGRCANEVEEQELKDGDPVYGDIGLGNLVSL